MLTNAFTKIILYKHIRNRSFYFIYIYIYKVFIAFIYRFSNFRTLDSMVRSQQRYNKIYSSLHSEYNTKGIFVSYLEFE